MEDSKFRKNGVEVSIFQTTVIVLYSTMERQETTLAVLLIFGSLMHSYG